MKNRKEYKVICPVCYGNGCKTCDIKGYRKVVYVDGKDGRIRVRIE